MADEKADRAGWKRESLKYRFFKKLEKLLLKSSHKIIVLTDDAKNYLESQFNLPADKISVIYTALIIRYSLEINYLIARDHLN